MSKILVTGATGSLGGAVVDFLLNKVSRDEIAVMVRSVESEKATALKARGVAVRGGDYNDYGSLLEAFRGVDKLYFVSGSDIAARTEQHQNVVEAAREAGVKHVVYTSFERKNETETSPIAMVAEAHIKTEKWLKESGLIYTILRHNVYMDFIPMFIGEKVLETGVIYFPAGEGKAAFALRTDMAEASAVVLTTEGHENKEYRISSDTAVFYKDIAAVLSELTGKEIAYISPSQQEYVKTLADAGVPAEYVGVFAGFAEATRQGEFDLEVDTIQRLIGRKPTSVKEFLQQVFATV